MGIAAVTFPTMLPSAALAYGALIPGVPTTAVMDR